MNRQARRGLAAALCGAVFALPAPAQSAPPQKFGSVYRREIDGLVNALCATRRDDGSLADGTALETAKVLTAMGFCHRFYSLADGPAMRKPIHFLFTRRTADGGFADPGGDPMLTTRWVLAALDAADPAEHRQELESGARWLEQRGVRGPNPWHETVQALAASIQRDGSDPKRAGADVAAAARDNPTVEALVHLVACQAVGRQLDGGAAPAPREFSAVAQKGIDFLMTAQTDGAFVAQTPQGAFMDYGLTGLGLAALQTKPRALRSEVEQKAVASGLAKLIAAQNEDGSFGKDNLNYTTSAAILALSMSGDKALEPRLVAAREFLLTIQNVESRGYARNDRDYGSVSYGGNQRGDLSNLGFAVDALRRTGLDAQHESFAKAIVFLQRTQNLRAVNDFEGRPTKDEDGEWHTIHAGDDGGAVYYPGNSPAGYVPTSEGHMVARSYGSMTYMLLRTYTLCGVEQDDPRIKRALDWLTTHWTLDENPGASPLLPEKTRYQGLHYYYMVLAQALDGAGLQTLTVQGTEGTTREIDWRAELRKALETRQQPDGSWRNDQNDRWWEDQPALCTIYALLALERCSHR